MESFQWLWTLAIVAIGVISAINNKKKRETAQAAAEAARAAMEARRAAKPKAAEGTFAKVIEELARALNDDGQDEPSPLPTFSPRPVLQTQPLEEEDYSLDTEYVMSIEDLDAERRYAGGEQSSRATYGGVGADHFESGIADYERLAAARSSGTLGLSAKSAGNSENIIPDNISDDDFCGSLREVLGGEFDLRRAVIESEILNRRF